MPTLVAILLLTITLPGHPTQIAEQPMATLDACLELAEAWLNQAGDTPVLRHGAKLSARCEVVIAPSIDH